MWDFLDDFGSWFTDNPALWTGLAAQVAGTVLKSRAREEIMQEQERLAEIYRARQRQLQGEADAEMAQTLPLFTRPAQDQARGEIQARLEQKLTPATSVEAEYVPGNPGAPQVVKTEIARQMTEAIRKGREHARATAALTSYGDQDLTNRIALGDNRRAVGDVANYMRGNTGAFEAGLPATLKAGQGMRTAADVANGVGALGIAYALTQPRTRLGTGGRMNIDTLLARGAMPDREFL